MTDAEESLDPPDDELGRLLSGLCDGALTEPERDRLEDLIRHNDAAKHFSASFLDLHARMAWRYRERSAGPIEDTADAGAEDSIATPRPRATGILQFLTYPLYWPLSGSLSPRILAIGVLAGLVSYFVGILVMVAIQREQIVQPHVERSLRSPEESGEPAETVAAGKHPVLYPGELGALDLSQDAHGLEDQAGAAPTAIEAQRDYHLTSGWAEIVLPRGTRIVLEGPATWRFESEQRLALHSGTLVARIPRAAVGFTVVAASAEIVDLGTEFGVTVVDGGPAEVEVQRGSVLVRAQDGAVAPTAVVSEKLVAGEGRKIVPGPGGQASVQSLTGSTSERYRRLASRPAAERATAAGAARVGVSASGELRPPQRLTVHAEHSVDHSTELAYEVSDRDLINAGQASLLSVEMTLPELSNGSNVAALNDGTLGIASSAGIPQSLPTGAWMDDEPWSATFNLSQPCDIERIESFAAWEEGRISQTYQVFVSTDPTRKVFAASPLAEVDFLTSGGTSRVQLTAKQGGLLARGATALRFDFAMPRGMRSMTTVYREIDVIGTTAAFEHSPTSQPKAGR